jgi:hypothetical protein
MQTNFRKALLIVAALLSQAALSRSVLHPNSLAALRVARGGGECEGGVCEIKITPLSTSSRNNKNSKKKVEKSALVAKSKMRKSEWSRFIQRLLGETNDKSLLQKYSHNLSHECHRLTNYLSLLLGSKLRQLKLLQSQTTKHLNSQESRQDNDEDEEEGTTISKQTIKSTHSSLPKSSSHSTTSRILGRNRRGSSSRSSSMLRIQRELHDFQTNPPPHCTVSVRHGQINVWVITLTGVKGTLFEGEKHKVKQTNKISFVGGDFDFCCHADFN